MSLDRIRALLRDADRKANQAGAATDDTVAQDLRAAAYRLRAAASRIAERDLPGVIHPQHQYGVVVGVTRRGLLEVVFGGAVWTVAVPADDVKDAEQ